MSLKITKLSVGPLDVNCYLVCCDDHKVCVLVDPGDASRRILSTVEKMGYKVEKIVNTHAHADHTGGVKNIKEATGALFYLHEDEQEVCRHPLTAEMANYIGVEECPEPDRTMIDGDTIDICPCKSMTVLHTPGHTPGSVCLLIGDTLLTGDTLFHMSVGRTDLHGGDSASLLNSIKTKISVLDENIKVQPGHGEGSTIKFERENNPFLSGSWI